MTIFMSEQAAEDFGEELDAQAQYPDPADPEDVLLYYPAWLAQGYVQVINLRAGLELAVFNHHLCDRWEVALPEREEWLSFHFHLTGEHQDACTEVGNLEYALCGSGLAPKGTIIGPDRYPTVEVNVWMSPEVFLSFVGNGGELSPELRHLIRPADQLYYTRVGTVSAAMQRVLWQIIRCPLGGITKRIYLESKVLEVSALVLEDEWQVQQASQPTRCGATMTLVNLIPDDIDRIYQAWEILQRQLAQPPTLTELAQQVGLNIRALKEGFRQVFGQPPFHYLNEHRLEQARLLLETSEMKVAEVATAVGFANRSHFAEQFKAKFGLNPKLYQVQRRKYF